jgi:Spy/CpxP family protein refolding chaperone
MKALVWVLMLATTLPLGAQQRADTAAVPPPNGAEAQQLRERIRHRWNEHVRSTLGLSDDQTAKLQGTEQRFEGQRQPIRAHQREINQALNAELAAGTPNQDRVRQLVNERQDNQVKLQQVNRDEAREMQGYLTPVQHARYQEERRRFQERVAEVVRHRREARRELPGAGAGPRGGVRKRPRP